MMAAYEFMYVTPSIQNLIRENKSFRIDSDIQTGKRYGMQLLDDNLFMNFMAGKISKEEAIDKSKNPGQMVARMEREGILDAAEVDPMLAEEAHELKEQGEGKKGPAAGPAGGGSSDEKASQAAAARARMMALQAKK
jgi:twitching motility protein PilT